MGIGAQRFYEGDQVGDIIVEPEVPGFERHLPRVLPIGYVSIEIGHEGLHCVLQQRAVMPRERRRDQHLGPIFTLTVETQQIGERQGLHHFGLDADANVAEFLEHLVARLVIVFERAGRQFGQRRQRAHGQRVAQGVAGVARQPIAPIEQPRHRSGAFANPLIRPIDHWRFPALPNLP